MRRQGAKGWVLRIGGLAAAAMLWPLPAAAQPARDCAALVADPDDYLDDPIEATVEQTRTTVATDIGGDVRVHIFATAGPDGIDRWAEDMLLDCPQWQGLDGNASPRFVLLAVAVEDRRTALFYGNDLAPALDPARPVVLDERMAPALRDGLYGSALNLGLSTIAVVVNDPDYFTPDPVDAPGSPVAPPVSGPATGATSGDDGFPWQGGLLVGGGALLGGGALALKRRRDLDAARTEAAARQTSATAAFVLLEQEWEQVRVRRDLLVEGVAARDSIATALTLEMDEAERAIAGARDELLRAPDPAAAEDREQARAAQAQWEAVAETVEAAAAEVTDVMAVSDALKEAIDGGPEALEAAKAAIEEAAGTIAVIAGEGFRVTECEADLVDARSVLRDGRSALDQGRPGDAASSAEDAEARGRAAATRALRLRELRDELPGRIRAARARTEELQAAADEAGRVFERVRAVYARTAWDDLVGTGETTSGYLGHTDHLITRAERLSTMERQSFEEAEQNLEEVEGVHEEIEAALDRVHERAADIETAEAGLPDALGAAEEIRASLQARLGTATRGITEGSRLAVQSAVRELEQAGALAEQRPADPVRALQAVHRAAGTLDAAQAAVQGDIQQHEAAVSRASSAISDARYSIQRATGMFDIVHGNTLQQARDLLARAEGLRDDDPNRALDLARQAQGLGEQVRRAKARHNGGSSWSVGSSFNDSGRSSFGSRSSFGGSSGSSGGGRASRSRGSSGFGGGGSSGW